jgi:hypothetical protein
VSTYVFREGLLCAVAEVETAKIHANGERSAFFRTVRNCLHETPHEVSKQTRAGVGEGSTKPSYALKAEIGRDSPLIMEPMAPERCLRAIGKRDTRWYSRPIDAAQSGRENWAIQRILIRGFLSGVPLGFWQKVNLEVAMKPFRLLKLPMILVGFGALAASAPSCKAQSEVSPDHFDGTDGWETAARKPLLPANKATKPSVMYQAQNKKASASVQLASAREIVNPMEQNKAALPDKKKQAARKSDKN